MLGHHASELSCCTRNTLEAAFCAPRRVRLPIVPAGTASTGIVPAGTVFALAGVTAVAGSTIEYANA
ncbi:hypothetical protein JOF55_000778 [Haloactinomyces albus]|uniref:Uncharacterized protein n=1 Tax=Haloactinomyces albus TaxID=1352928 RepID=A0AAE4CM43_9ACTN|nr:hypothetical protein [Haloactinomyces albus]